MEPERRPGGVLDHVVDEAVRAEHDAAAHMRWPLACTSTHAVVADDDPLDLGAVRVVQPVREAPLQVGEHLLAEQPAVRAALAVRQHRRVAVVVGLEELPDPRLRDDGVEPGELGRDLVEELGILRDDAGLEPEPAVAAHEVVAQVDLDVVAA